MHLGLDGVGQTVDPFALIKVAVPVKGAVLSPQLLDVIEPFLSHCIAVAVVARQIHPKGIVFRLVPACDNIQPESPPRHLIEGCKLFGYDDGVIESSVHSGKNLNVF